MLLFQPQVDRFADNLYAEIDGSVWETVLRYPDYLSIRCASNYDHPMHYEDLSRMLEGLSDRAAQMILDGRFIASLGLVADCMLGPLGKVRWIELLAADDGARGSDFGVDHVGFFFANQHLAEALLRECGFCPVEEPHYTHTSLVVRPDDASGLTFRVNNRPYADIVYDRIHSGAAHPL